MMRSTIILTLTSLIGLSAAKSGPPHGKIVSCALSVQSQQIESESQFILENANFNLCTHLIYIDRSSLKGEDPWDSRDVSNLLWRNNEYKELTDLRKNYPHLKVCLFIDHLQPNFYVMTTRPRSRLRYIENAIAFLLEHKFNGLDINWRNVGEKFDETLVMLVKELKEEFEKHDLILTASFSGKKEELSQDHRYAVLSKYLDFMHFTLLYTSNHDHPDNALKQYGILNLKSLIETLLRLNVPSTKIVIGLKFGGLEFDVVSGTITDLGYDQMCKEFSNDQKKRWNKSYDADNSLAVAKQLDEFIPFYRRIFVFENTRSIANRMRYVIERNLGGAMAVLINTDDFSGKCGMDRDTYADYNIAEDMMSFQQNEGQFPLLQTINDAIVVATDEMFQEAQFQLE